MRDVRRELCEIRDKVNVLIDAIDRVPKTSSSTVSRESGRREVRVATESTSSAQPAQPTQSGVKSEGIYIHLCICVLH